MARRGGVEAGKRVGRVLNAREGGNVRFGMTGRVLVGMGVVLAAVPAIVLSASHMDAVSIQQPPAANLGLGAQAELRQTQAAVPTVVPTRQQVKQVKVDRIRVTPLEAVNISIIPQPQEPAQEPEPWRSTRTSAGADVVAPIATVREIPKYTPDAMRAKIQGMVAVEIIVSPEGNVTAARVIKSLDKELGLDEEALKVARLWKFVPGTYQGQAVAMRVMIDLEFRLH
jgi:TonB family protein